MEKPLPNKEHMTKIVILCFLVITAHSCTSTQTGKTVEVEGEFPLSERWSFTTPTVISAIATSDGVVAASAGGKIYAFDPVSGNTLWTNDAYGWTLSITDGVVYVANSSELNAFEENNGELLWTTKLKNGSSDLKIADVSNKYVFLVQPGVWLIEAYDVHSGELIWRVPCSRGRTDIIGVEDVYVLTSDELSVYGSSPVPILARQEAGSTGPGLFESGLLYYLVATPESQSEKMKAVDVSDFSVAWEKTIIPTVNAMSKNSDRIFLSTYRGILALNASDGQEMWESNIGEDFLTGAVVIDNVVYAKAPGPKAIYALSLENGEIPGKITIVDDSAVEPYASYATGIFTTDNLLFFFDRDRLYAYGKP